jgi:hypothetical protein
MVRVIPLRESTSRVQTIAAHQTLVELAVFKQELTFKAEVFGEERVRD